MAEVLTDLAPNIFSEAIRGFPPDDYYIGWGTGAGTSASSDTTLFSEAAEPRRKMTVTNIGTGVNSFYGIMQSISAQDITNVGIFDAFTGGTLIAKADFAAESFAIGEGMEFTFVITHANA